MTGVAQKAQNKPQADSSKTYKIRNLSASGLISCKMPVQYLMLAALLIAFFQKLGCVN